VGFYSQLIYLARDGSISLDSHLLNRPPPRPCNWWRSSNSNWISGCSGGAGTSPWGEVRRGGGGGRGRACPRTPPLGRAPGGAERWAAAGRRCWRQLRQVSRPDSAGVRGDLVGFVAVVASVVRGRLVVVSWGLWGSPGRRPLAQGLRSDPPRDSEMRGFCRS